MKGGTLPSPPLFAPLGLSNWSRCIDLEDKEFKFMSFYQVLLEQFTRFMSGKLIKNVQLSLYVKFTARGGEAQGGT